MIINKNTYIKTLLIITIFINSSYLAIGQKNFIDGIIYYKDSSIDSCKVKIDKNNFYSSIKIIKNNRTEKIHPENVKKILTANEKYISIHFDSVTYGMESYSFAKIVEDFELKLLWTKFKEKTCTCQKYGAIERAYFLYFSDDNFIRIYTDIGNNIINIDEIRDFYKKYCNINPDKIKKISDIKK